MENLQKSLEYMESQRNSEEMSASEQIYLKSKLEQMESEVQELKKLLGKKTDEKSNDGDEVDQISNLQSGQQIQNILAEISERRCSVKDSLKQRQKQKRLTLTRNQGKNKDSGFHTHEHSNRNYIQQKSCKMRSLQKKSRLKQRKALVRSPKNSFENHAFNEMKAYAIVSFIEEDSVEVIPSNWLLNDTETRWPNITSTATVAKYIKERCLPCDSWITVRITIYGFSNSFKNAKERAALAEETSNLGSDSSEELEPGKRKRKRPIRFESDNSISESEALIPQKRYHFPKLPKEYKSAKETAALAEETSNLGSDSSEELETGKRKRKRPIRFESDNSISESESLIPQKRYNIPKLPKAAENNIYTDDEDSNVGAGNQTASNTIFEYLDVIRSEIRSLSEKQDKMNHHLERLTGTNELFCLDSNLSPEIDLPVNSDLMLSELNEKIKNDAEFSAKMVRYLHSIGIGKTPRSYILSISKKLLTSELAVNYSRIGRKGKKSFSQYGEILNVILAAASLKYKQCSREELSELFGKALAGAADWNGRQIRPSKSILLCKVEDV